MKTNFSTLDIQQYENLVTHLLKNSSSRKSQNDGNDEE